MSQTNVRKNEFKQLCTMIERNIHQVMVGKDEAIEMLLIALASGGHVLIEDVPGIGKTTLVSALAKSLDLSFNRIQFTPDLMPSDVTGFNMFNQQTGVFEFQPGAVMSQIVLADEINRTSPKTQSALLEVMQENQVTVDGVTYTLPQPFMVMATQNPVEHLGTYPLPEAQLDRFMLKISLGYPSLEEEMKILDLTEDSTVTALDVIRPIAHANDILWMRKQAAKVHVADSIKRYIAEIASATRMIPDVQLGASPRASSMLLQAAKGKALLSNRDFVRPQDVQSLVVPVFAHRLALKPESKLKNITPEDILISVLKRTPVPER